MKKNILILIITFILSMNSLYAINDTMVQTYKVDNKFGLIIGNEKITEAKYLKLIRLGDNAWVFLEKNKYGIINSDGEILAEPIYTKAHRFTNKFVKLGLKDKYILYNKDGIPITQREYSSIEILYGKMFLIEKNYKYGLITYDGDFILAPVCDDIYMPDQKTIRIKYDNVWYEVEKKNQGDMILPDTILSSDEMDKNFKITQIVQNPIASTGYGVINASDYLIKLFSSISPAYEKTIDDLVFNYGADSATVLMKSSWILKFPIVYTKNYFNHLKAPNNGPLSSVKANFKNKMNK